MHDDRDPESLLVEMITVHMQNVAVGGVSAYMNNLLLKSPQMTENDLVAATRKFMDEEKQQKQKGVSGFLQPHPGPSRKRA